MSRHGTFDTPPTWGGGGCQLAAGRTNLLFVSGFIHSGGERGIPEGQAQGATRLPSRDEGAHLPPLGQVDGREEGLDPGEFVHDHIITVGGKICWSCCAFVNLAFGRERERLSLFLDGVSRVCTMFFQPHLVLSAGAAAGAVHTRRKARYHPQGTLEGSAHRQGRGSTPGVLLHLQ